MAETPNIWGAGQLFAFSGMDGQTSWEHPMVGSLMGDVIGVDFHQSPDVRLVVKPIGDLEYEIVPEHVLGDAVAVLFKDQAHEAEAVMTFANRFTVIGKLDEGLGVELQDCPEGVVDTGDRAFVLLAKRTNGFSVFALAMDPEGVEAARRRAEAALEADINVVWAQRVTFISTIDDSKLQPPADLRTYLKAASILKTNVMSPEGQIIRRWTTPDRWPHRHMWLWDSAFHAIGWAHLCPMMAQDAIEAMVEMQHDDGMIPLCSAPAPQPYAVSQPPLLAWGAWEVYEHTWDPDFLGRLYAPLCAYVDWFCRERDRNRNGLLEWVKNEEDELCHCGESGLDNSPRFDEPGIDDHVDLSCMIFSEMKTLARIASLMGDQRGAETWHKRADILGGLINEKMWDPQSGFYYDLRADGSLLPLKTCVGFLPIWAGVADQQQARRVVTEHLCNPAEFASAFPVPTVALDEPSHSDDMWRGPTWININYLIYRGLRRSGFAEEAASLRAITLQELQRWYEDGGSIYEYYDTHARVHPHELHRKGGVGSKGGYGIGTISDYGFSAALYVAMAHDTGAEFEG